MASLDDARRIASALPGVVEAPDRFGFSVPHKGKVNGFAWTWNERIDPKKARVPNPEVLVVVVGSLSAKETLLDSDSRKFFTEPHYNGFPAVLVRLAAVDARELEDLIIEGWRCKAPAELAQLIEGG